MLFDKTKLSSITIKIFFFFCTMVLSCFFVFFYAQANSGIIINQIQIKGDGGADDEFVELFNASSSSINLNGWSLQYKSYSGDYPLTSTNKKDLGNICLAAGDYLLLFGNSYNGAVTGDIKYTFSLSGNSTGATIFLSATSSAITSGSDSNIEDKFAYGSSQNNSPLGSNAAMPAATSTPASDWAFTRVSNSSNNNLDFSVLASSPHHAQSLECAQKNSTSTTSTTTNETGGTPTSTNLNIPNTVKISEIMPNPIGDDSGNEAVELYNSSQEAINLDGWFLSDSGGSNIYQIVGQSIAPESFLSLIIPKGFFVLNNSQATGKNFTDAVNLYFTDKTLLDSVSYTGDAKENWSWQNVAGVFMWGVQTLGQKNAAPPPEPISSGSGGSGGAPAVIITAPTFIVAPTMATTVNLSEIMVKPSGNNLGRQWVELFNFGAQNLSLAGWKLDRADINASSSSLASTNFIAPSDKAYTFVGNVILPAYGYFVVAIPSDKFVLKNSDTLRLFDANNKLFEQISFVSSPENKSYSKSSDGLWNFLPSTPGKPNYLNTQPVPVFISELLPAPKDDDEEFVEIFNATTATSSLLNFKIVIGEKTKTLNNILLPPFGYYVIYQEDLPTRLRNSGQTIKLLDAAGRSLSEITYLKALPGQSYALNTGSLNSPEYFWQSDITPGQPNKIILAASTITPAINSIKKTSVSASSKRASINQNSQGQVLGTASVDIAELNNKIAMLENKIDVLTETLNKSANLTLDQKNLQNNFADEPKKSTNNLILYIFLTVLGVTLFLFLIKWNLAKS